MAVNAFDIDENTGEAIDRLKEKFGVLTRAQVLKRAIALALASAQYVDQHGVLTLRDMRKDAAADAIVEINIRQ